MGNAFSFHVYTEGIEWIESDSSNHGTSKEVKFLALECAKIKLCIR